ncbi:formimidoylglutamate deiminase [Cutibacterium sp. WCA-380-WT-3A]|uniref:Formimidoylglutamate deiminase n=1 Tax=Cutibacterium porci TaxID=2605781 RepID=A0A7K0J991_9ACTN|nr:formimidoylglutamate deiminase [Cutibacterium porci]MSS46393.1 formimidoylglutamate deiminase [Cutibacterium porci]
MSEWFFPKALVSGQITDNVRIETHDGVVTAVAVGAEPHHHTFNGVGVPGFANTHSHVFHRGLRGAGAGEDFWSWRTDMYRLATCLDPDSYYRLARAAFAEMVAAGYTSVGEFHYVHHQPDGTPYPDHAMELALVSAAIEAGIRITILDTCYLHAGPGAPLGADQIRFGDGSVERWLERWHALRDALPDSPLATMGAALHSVRAVSPDEMATAVTGLPPRVPIHIHVSEQPRENAECLAAHGLTPTAVLDHAGVLSDRTTIVHATHLDDADIAMIAASDTVVSLCPTTEADLGDGIARIKDLHDAGVRMTIGTDEDVVTDPFAELRMLESTARLATGTRGVVSCDALWTIGTRNGVESLRPAPEPRSRRAATPGSVGLSVGDPADIAVVDPSSVRLAGVDPMRWPLVATADDIAATIVAGQWNHHDAATAEDLRHVLKELRGRHS